MALTLFRWIHVLAASLWLGSLVFIIVVMRAPVQELGGRTTLDPMLVKFRRRFKALMIATITALAVSGIGALVVQRVPLRAGYIILVIVKILLSAGVITLFWYVAIVRDEPRKRPPETVGAPQQGTPGASPDTHGSELPPVSRDVDDADFFFRPKPRQAFVQWWIVGATAAVVLLGLLAAHKATGLAELREDQQRREKEQKLEKAAEEQKN